MNIKLEVGFESTNIKEINAFENRRNIIARRL